MTAAETLLAELHRQGFRLTPAGERIIVSPASKLTDEIRTAIRANKPDLLRVLAPALPANLETRIRAMCQRWGYSDAEIDDALERARIDQVAWTDCVQLDEEREAEFRARGVFSRIDA